MTNSTLYPRLTLPLALLAVVSACDKKTSTARLPGAPAARTAPSAAAGGEATVVARVNGAPITRWDVKALAGKGGHGAVPGAGRKKIVLDNVILQEAARQRAVKLGLDREGHLQRELGLLRARAVAQERRVLYEALLQRELRGKREPTEAELKKYWDDNGANLRSRVHVLQILRRDRPSILKAQAALKAGKSFEQVARDRPGLAGIKSSHKFWDVGFLRWSMIPSAWRGPLSKLKVGQVSGVVKGPASRFWILKVEARTEDKAGTFDSYRATIKRVLERDSSADRRRQLLDGLRRDARIEYTLDKGKPAR